MASMSLVTTPTDTPTPAATLAPSPGEILEKEFLEPMGLTRYRLAKETGLTETRIGEIIRGTRSITAGTALRFAVYFGNSAGFWLNLQNDYDLIEAKARYADELKGIVPHPGAAQRAKEVQ